MHTMNPYNEVCAAKKRRMGLQGVTNWKACLETTSMKLSHLRIHCDLLTDARDCNAEKLSCFHAPYLIASLCSPAQDLFCGAQQEGGA